MSEAMRLTVQDRRILQALVYIGGPESPGLIAREANIRTSSPRETAARHCIKLTKMRFAFKSGSAMFPKWGATFDGRSALLAGPPNGRGT